LKLLKLGRNPRKVLEMRNDWIKKSEKMLQILLNQQKYAKLSDYFNRGTVLENNIK